MSLRERVESAVETRVDAETLAYFDPDRDQEWHADREDTMSDVEDGGSVVCSGDCDMLDLLETAEERGWAFREEAAEVFVVEPK